ncbi:HNH homing endonuclease [Bacillus phage vB_BceH_LY2]|nr:HNH homing endonuclease [Bacillus phage vB_BceH_LY2]
MEVVIDEKGYKTKSIQPRPIVCEINDNGCWVPKDIMRDSYGYAIVTRYRKKIKLHRYVYMLNTGDMNLSKEIVIRHKCDNRECCNLAHLTKGTVQDNNQDMVDRGRYRTGVNHSKSYLKKEDYFLIVELLKNNNGREVSRMTGITYDIVREIKNNTHWSCKEFGVRDLE